MNFPFSADLWHYLQQTKKTVVLYGMGNGADKILAVCDRYGIPVADFFASDGFVRGHSFHGKTVLSYSDIKRKYGANNIIVLLSFASSLPSVLALFDQIAAECEFYAPDVPVFGETLFTWEFAKEHAAELQQVYDLLADETSRLVLEQVIYYKLSGKISYLRQTEADKDAVYRELLHAETIETALDLGAYNGDTVRELMTYAPRLKTVYAMEPDRRSFRKLNDFAASLSSPTVHAIQAAAWSQATALSFADSGNRNAGAFSKGKTVTVDALSPDQVVGDATVDYIKYDVEGAEREAIAGSTLLIRRCAPRLLVSVYHRSEDLFALPLLIHRIHPSYRLYLRRYPYVPAWDLNLICIEE